MGEIFYLSSIKARELSKIRALRPRSPVSLMSSVGSMLRELQRDARERDVRRMRSRCACAYEPNGASGFDASTARGVFGADQRTIDAADRALARLAL